jgi:putative membrane-bound dehydrogenase-like protein
MKRLALASGLLLAVVPWVPGDGPKPPAPSTHQVKLNGHTFTLPADFDIELVAGPPLVERPIVADFDEQGRLYVADSSGSNEPVVVQVVKKPHRILRLEDSDGDGRFDKRTVFADRMMFPEGVMWLDGSLYVAAPPSIWKLTDSDGDGVAEQRVEWFQGKTLTGCANDLHGPYAGPDGWVYWCKGAFAQQTYPRPLTPNPSPPRGEGRKKEAPRPPGERGRGEGGRQPFVTRASHIFRCRPDGSGLEPVMTGGMDNPVDVVFTPGGERIFTTTFFQHPGGGKRDGLIHAVYGGVYGKDHAVIYDHPWTAPTLMPVLTHLGPAAPCGLVRHESSAFGSDYQDNLFAALFNMHKVTRHVLRPKGSTFETRDEDFLVSDNLDFHPTDVVEDADGSLLVIDTGGWYKLCCPTSQLHKPDILGGIYRIRRKGAPRLADPRGLKLSWARASAGDLAGRLADSRPAVCRRAVQALGKMGGPAVAELAKVVRSGGSAEARRNAVWAATRIDDAGARAVARTALADADETVRQAALHSISVRRDREAVPELLKVLKSPSMHNKRAAAEALGRIGDGSVVPALFDAIVDQPDRVLSHSLTFALIEMADPARTAAGLKSPSPLVRQAALTALDQMEGGGLQPAAVTAEFASSDAPLKETAWWIAGRHPEWASAVAGFLRQRMAAADGLAPAAREELIRQLAQLARGEAVQRLLAERLVDPSAGRVEQRLVLRAMAQSGLKEAPPDWVSSLVAVLGGHDVEVRTDAVRAASALRITPKDAGRLAPVLLKIGSDGKAPAPLRVSALSAVPGGLAKVEPGQFAFLVSQLQPNQPVGTRTTAASVLAKAKQTPEQLLALAETLKGVGPMELDRLLEAFGQSTDEKVGLAFVLALKEADARSSLRSEAVRARLAKYGARVQKEAEGLYAILDVDAARQRARLEELLAELKDGDVRRGQVVFNSTKAACASCHAIGYLGGKVGPDLTHIGKVRSERDLLESIVFPSASFVRSYEPVLVSTKKGKVYNGLLRKDGLDEVVLTTGANEEARIPRDEVEEMQPGKVSVMPAGLDQQLSRRDLADLVAFLRACK